MRGSVAIMPARFPVWNRARQRIRFDAPLAVRPELVLHIFERAFNFST